MAKMGKMKPSDWGRFQPPQNPQSKVGPWYYRDTECVVIEFETDPEAALAVMPSDVELIEPATAVLVIEMNHWTTLGPYGEVYLAFLAKYNGEITGYVPGVYVTGENSQIVGREVFGFGKKRPHYINLITHGNGTVEAVMDVFPGDGAIRATMMPAKNEPAEYLGALPMMTLRIVPDAEGGPKPTLAQLVEASFVALPVIGTDGRAEVYSGSAELAFGAPSDVRFPVKKVLKATYGRFNAELPYPKVKKTYTDEELKGCV